MAEWRKEAVDTARHGQEKRDVNDDKGSCHRTRKPRTREAIPVGLVGAEGILYGHTTDRDLHSAYACGCVTWSPCDHLLFYTLLYAPCVLFCPVFFSVLQYYNVI